ncbi:MAG: carbon starvation protein A [Pirellulales bacterium]|nr:carbon starvation protein A [Pirellulales bacterium]
MTENAAVVTLVAFGALILAYFTYGRFLGRRIFRLERRRLTPSHTLTDGVDYVPTRAPILFGHHFASIAGLGPILGPAIAVIWGWGPAVLWVVLGSIFIGAVHDLGALKLSICYQGRSIGDICQNLMGPRARMLALVIIFFLMSLAMGSFCNAIADLFINYNPDAIIPSFGLMVVAVLFGVSLYKFRVPLWLGTIVALAVFGGLIVLGVETPVTTYEWFCSVETQAALTKAKEASSEQFPLPYGADSAVKYLKATGQEAAAGEIGTIKAAGTAVSQANYAWIGVLLFYGFLASVLPVWFLLQPRDYINSFQLYFALGAMFLGLCLAGIRGTPSNHIEAPMIRSDVADAPLMLPFLFVTIACGAVSGFHSLVSSGTTVKQLNRETDAMPIGYGAMLVEGALAVLVIMSCVAGLEPKAWQLGGTYASWSSIQGGGLAMQLNAMFRGGAFFLEEVGLPHAHARTFLAVTVVAFALTTLDSATRLLRFNVQEIARSMRLGAIANRYTASAIAVAGIGFFALVPAGKTLWILFGATNQLLAGLALLAVSVFLYKLGRPVVYTLIPMVLMLTVSVAAMILSMPEFWEKEQWTLFGVSLVVLVMALWLTAEGLLTFARGRTGEPVVEPPCTLAESPGA